MLLFNTTLTFFAEKTGYTTPKRVNFMATQLKLAVIQGGRSDMSEEHYNHEFFTFIGTSLTGGLVRVSLDPYWLERIAADVHASTKATSSPGETLLLELVTQLRGEKNSEKRTALKRKFDALYSFAIPEHPTSEIAFEEGKKVASEWVRSAGYSTIVHDYANLRESGSVDQHGNILNIFSRENEIFYRQEATQAFPWRQREAMSFFLNRLNTQMEALARNEDLPYDPHGHLNADLVRESATKPNWIKKEERRRLLREKLTLPTAGLDF